MHHSLLAQILTGGGMSFVLSNAPSMEKLENMLNPRPKTPAERKLSAKINGRESEIAFLGRQVDELSEEIDTKDRQFEEMSAIIEDLQSRLGEMAVNNSALQMAHGEEISKKEKHIANLTTGKQACVSKLSRIREILNEPVSIRDTKAELLRIIEEVKSAL